MRYYSTRVLYILPGLANLPTFPDVSRSLTDYRRLSLRSKIVSFEEGEKEEVK